MTAKRFADDPGVQRELRKINILVHIAVANLLLGFAAVTALLGGPIFSGAMVFAAGAYLLLGHLEIKRGWVFRFFRWVGIKDDEHVTLDDLKDYMDARNADESESGGESA